MLHRSRLIPLLLALAVALAACATSSSTPTTPTTQTTPTTPPTTPGDGATTPTTPTEPPSPSAAPIKLGFSAWPGWFPWQVAQEAGIFEEVGVDVELVWFEGYLDSLNAMAAGQLDANSQTLNDTLASVGAGAEQVIVLANDNSTGNDQIIVREGIDAIEDLVGTRIGIEVGVVVHFLLLLGLEDAGIDPGSVDVVNLETGAAAAQFASGSGDLDGVGVFAPFTTQALQLPGSSVLFTSADHPGAIPDHLVVSPELVAQRPDDVQLLVDAWFRTLDWIADNRDEALAILSSRAGVSVEDYLTYDAGTTLFSIEDNLEAFTPGDDFRSLHYTAELIADFLVDAEFVPERPSLDGVFDASFVEDYAARHG